MIYPLFNIAHKLEESIAIFYKKIQMIARWNPGIYIIYKHYSIQNYKMI